jgi:hypothetical protein
VFYQLPAASERLLAGFSPFRDRAGGMGPRHRICFLFIEPEGAPGG